MSQNSSTFLDELVDAARGCFALLTGNRQAPTHFDFSQRGLIGSFIAFVVASALGAFGPQLFGVPSAPGAATQAVILGGMLFVIQFAVSYLVLRQMGRLDGFVPFLVADNWATFFTSILSLGLLLSGLPADVVIIAIGIVVIIVEINIARLIVTLPPLQIAMFIVAQLVGSGIGLLLLGGMVAMPGV
ncbi:hypothetical protein ABIB57_002714 [Devosia sp. UYZn731]|uniref:hypothetical protein n=1 Tax=Devosia sp. UYZn731 TaxID=3156345 RepID=UPI00339968EC